MCDKTLKGIEEIEQIVRTASKDDLDKETMDAKLDHIQRKLSNLKQEIKRKEEKHRKDIKDKEKQISRLKKNQQQLEEKLAEAKHKAKQTRHHHGRHHDENYLAGGMEDDCQENHFNKLERQTQKKRDAQEKVKECKREIQELKQQLVAKQKENSLLKEEIETQKIIISEFMKSDSESSSQISQSQDENGQEAQPKKLKIMDLSEGRQVSEREEEDQKVHSDKQTQDQQDVDPDESPSLLTTIKNHSKSFLEDNLQEETQQIQSLSSKNEELSQPEPKNHEQNDAVNEQKPEKASKKQEKVVWWLRWFRKQ